MAQSLVVLPDLLMVIWWQDEPSESKITEKITSTSLSSTLTHRSMFILVPKVNLLDVSGLVSCYSGAESCIFGEFKKSCPKPKLERN